MIKTTKPALATGKKRAIIEKLTSCKIKTTRPSSVTGNKRRYHETTYSLRDQTMRSALVEVTRGSSKVKLTS